MTLEQIEQFLESLSDLGPLPGILLPLLEAFLPFLPFIVIIAANVNIYGLGLGVLFSWIGTMIGAACIFLICRHFGNNVGAKLKKKYPNVNRFFGFIEQKGFTPLFLLSCFPFTPSVILTIVAGLSNLPLHTFLVAIGLGKAFMILCIGMLSFDLSNLFAEPWRMILSILAVALLWWGGKKLEKRFAKH